MFHSDDAQPAVLSTDLPAGVYLLDVREDDEWAAGHAPDAVHIPVGVISERAADLKAPVLLVDDQVDTGWTMTVAAARLRDAGAPAVLPLVLATTTG